MSENSNTGTLVMAFTGGALLGAGLALLFAPQSGRKTRQQIKGMAEDVEERAEEMVQEALESIQEAGKKGEKWAGKAKDYVLDKKAQLASVLDTAH